MNERPELENRLALHLHRMVAASGRIAHRYASATGLNPSDLAALLHVWEASTEARSVTASQLAGHLNVTPSAVTYLVDRLVDRGYVERVPDPHDRRQTHVRLSTNGGLISHGYLSPLGDWLGNALAERSDADVALFADMLHDLTEAMTRIDLDNPTGTPRV